MCKLINSAFIIIITLTPFTSFAHDGEKHVIKGHSKADMLDQCVEPTEIMQKEHFVFLYHQRDETVIDGIRTKQHSLANCIDCHVSYDEIGKPIPVTDDGQFCQACHVKTAVNIDCFTCHATVPRGKPMKSNKSVILEDQVENILISLEETNHE